MRQEGTGPRAAGHRPENHRVGWGRLRKFLEGPMGTSSLAAPQPMAQTDRTRWGGLGEGEQTAEQEPDAQRTQPLGSSLPLGHPDRPPSRPQAPESGLGMKQAVTPSATTTARDPGTHKVRSKRTRLVLLRQQVRLLMTTFGPDTARGPLQMWRHVPERSQRHGRRGKGSRAGRRETRQMSVPLLRGPTPPSARPQLTGLASRRLSCRREWRWRQ